MPATRGFRGAGEGAAAGAGPAGKQSHHPRGWEELCTQNMQIYVNSHANKQHLLRQQLGHFFWATVAGGPLRHLPGLGMRGRAGVRGGGAGRRGVAWLPAGPSRLGRLGQGPPPPRPPRPQLPRSGRKQRLVLSDVPLLQDDLSLPGRQLGLVVAQRPQLLRLFLFPLQLLLLLSLLLFSRQRGRVGTEPPRG